MWKLLSWKLPVGFVFLKTSKVIFHWREISSVCICYDLIGFAEKASRFGANEVIAKFYNANYRVLLAPKENKLKTDTDIYTEMVQSYFFNVSNKCQLSNSFAYISNFIFFVISFLNLYYYYFVHSIVLSGDKKSAVSLSSLPRFTSFLNQSTDHPIISWIFSFSIPWKFIIWYAGCPTKKFIRSYFWFNSIFCCVWSIIKTHFKLCRNTVPTFPVRL